MGVLTCSRGQCLVNNGKQWGFRVASVSEIRRRQSQCWPLLLQGVEEVEGAHRGGGEENLDVILGCTYEIISSSNWRIKSFG